MYDGKGGMDDGIVYTAFYDYNDDAALCIVHFGEGWPNNSGQ